MSEGRRILPRNDCERVKKAFHFALEICLTEYPDENTMPESSGSVLQEIGRSDYG